MFLTFLSHLRFIYSDTSAEAIRSFSLLHSLFLFLLEDGLQKNKSKTRFDAVKRKSEEGMISETVTLVRSCTLSPA